MTAEERATKICQMITGYWDSTLVARVAAQISEAEKLAEERGYLKAIKLTKGFSVGFRAGQESMRKRAAKVAEEFDGFMADLPQLIRAILLEELK